MALYHKYRPNTFEEIVGNDQIIPSIQSMLENKKTCPHAFLLHGPTGCGKTTIGRIIARKLGCSGNDLREIDTADFRGIDTIREIRKQSQFMPLEGNCRVWILDECHQLGNAAQSALLKALEDTPSHVYYILCTTDPQKLLPTIWGRCSQFQVQPLTEKDMFRLLRQVVKAENENLSKVVYEQITQDSLGYPRNALQILDQVLHAPTDKRLEIAKQTAEEQSQSIELCRALIKREGWKYIASILTGLQNQDPESIRRHVLEYCNSVLLKGENDQAGLIMENFVEPFYHTGKPGLTFAAYSVVKGE
jgi:DNA polymerase III subunit gamma/tau